MLSVAWNLMSLTGAPYMWSLTMLGREARRSKRATRPLVVPTAHCSPLSSKRSAVRPSPACPPSIQTLLRSSLKPSIARTVAFLNTRAAAHLPLRVFEKVTPMGMVWQVL